MKIRMMLIILLAVLFAAQVDAQYRDRPRATESSIGVGPQIGYQRAADADAGRIMVGAFIRAKLSMAFALDASVNYRTEDYGSFEVTSWPVMLSALIYPLPAVYGIAGIGWHFSTISYNNDRFVNIDLADLDDRTTSPFGFHLGAGLEIPLADKMKLFGDIKYVFLDYDLEDIGDVRLSDISSNFYLINIGLAFGLR
jgi:opacity protein-like surface antigen